MSRKSLAALALAALSATAFGAPVGSLASGPMAPEEVPDRGPVLAERVERGQLLVEDAGTAEPSTKSVDGDPSDWVGESARIAGLSHIDAGEFIHTDFLFDAYGADDGGDIARWNRFAGLLYTEERTERVDDVARTSGSQLGVPEPIGAEDHYGDLEGGLANADLTDLRFAVQDDELHVLVRTSSMSDASDLAVTLLADLDDSGLGDASGTIAADLGGFDRAIVLSLRGSRAVTSGGGFDLEDLDEIEVAADASGWTNTFEASLPLDLVTEDDDVLDLGVITGLEPEGTEPGEVTPANIAFRHAEPIDIWNDRMQAFALHGDAPDGSTVDAFRSGPIDLDALEDGASQTAAPGPGYHEVLFTSGENISTEGGQDALTQHYGLYVPSSYEADDELDPANFWMHYRGGKAHSAATINPRLIHSHGEEIDALVFTPRGRGTSTWYVTQAHQDFFEVYDDAHRRFPDIDPQRRYLSGYSMGGYGTWLMSTLYPDLFAAGYAVSGAVTQGMWTGAEEPACPCFVEANEGDAEKQLTYRLLENLRHFPIQFDHGTFDELVPITGIERMAARLTELGYEHRFTRFLGYEHFTQAAVDEWSDGTRYQASHVLPEQPRNVTYKVVPAFLEALNTVRAEEGEVFGFRPDGAWWVDDIVVRDADPTDVSSFGMVDAQSHAVEGNAISVVPEAPAANPLYHSTPNVRTGLDRVELPLALVTANRLTATLTGVEHVSFDLAAAGLDPTGLEVSLDVDGPGTARLVGAASGFATASGNATVTVDGADLVLTWNGPGTVTYTAA